MSKSELPRLDQDINFEVGGVTCMMRLDTSAMGAVEGDLWIIQPRDPIYIEGHPEKRGAHFTSRIPEALEKLQGLNRDGIRVREPRQRYDWQSYYGHAYLRAAEYGEWTLAQGIMTSLPDWDGDSLDFYGGYRLARLLADWKDGIPEIVFTRSDGSKIEYEQYLDPASTAPPFEDPWEGFEDELDY